MAEIRQIFEAECSDGLDVIEAGLLALENGDDAGETINDIFRGAHSIKGGAATFGYTNIAEFTHVMETLLDRVRSNELAISPPLVQMFLESVDCLREMVDAMDDGNFDKSRAEQVKAALSVWLDRKVDGGAVITAPAAEDDTISLPVAKADADSVLAESEKIKQECGVATEKVWDIVFKPNPQFLRTGNQPHHILRALKDLGEVKMEADHSGIPDDLAQFNPLETYLKWRVELTADVGKEDIVEVFDWVETECEFDIRQKVEPVAAPAEEFDRRQGDRRKPELQDRRQSDRRGGKKESGSIRVDIEKIDTLLNLVGEMVINQAMLSQSNRNRNNGGSDMELDQGLLLLERTTRELQEAVMEIRMLPVGVTFSRFPRLVYDLSSKLNKKVELKITGEQTELDKTVLETISDPLLHLIRNSLDHGIESPEQRILAGKDETGTVHLSASHEGGSVVIRVADDGAGLNAEKILAKAIDKRLVGANEKLTESQIHNLIFHPGFSTADQVTDISGRGVGMDVVKSNIEEIGGRVEVTSEAGNGSIFQITLPLTLAILDGQLVRVSNEVYVIPLLSIVESVQVNKNLINVISGREVVYRLRGEAIPVIDMRAVCRIHGVDCLDSFDDKQMIIVESGRRSVGLIVDELLDQHQVVIKSLETNFVKVPGMVGATILGDGTVALIVDVTSLSDNIARELSDTVAKDGTTSVEH